MLALSQSPSCSVLPVTRGTATAHTRWLVWGAAAAVAAGILPCAGAIDGGGSIRVPASACGLFGLKAYRCLISPGRRTGHTATDGVISRSVRDSAAMLDVVWSYYGRALPAGAGNHTSPGAVAEGAATANLLTDLGHDVVELERAPFDDCCGGG